MLCALHLTGLSLVEATSRDFQSTWYMGEESACDPPCLITIWVVLSPSFLKGPFLLTLINLPQHLDQGESEGCRGLDT